MNPAYRLQIPNIETITGDKSMSAISLKPKWTLFFLRALLVVQSITILAFLAAYLLKPQNGSSVAFIVGFIGLFAAFNMDTLVRLQRKESRGWTQAIIIASLSLFNITFPLAVATLVELLNDKKKKAYLEGTEYTNDSKITPLLAGGLATAFMIGAFALLVMIGNSQVDQKAQSVASSFELNPDLAYEELQRLGAECNTARNLECSEAVYTKLIEIDPSHMIAIANLAMTKTKLKKHEDADRLYKIFFANSEVAVDVLAYYGETLTALEKYEDALILYKDFVIQYPNYIDVATSYFSLLQRVRGSRDALDALETYLQKMPNARKHLYQMHRELLQKSNEAQPVNTMESV